MSIYTKTGDLGETSLYGGTRVLKSHLQVEAYGTVDELSSLIGWVHTIVENENEQSLLIQIQKDLYGIMARLSGSLKPSLAFLSSHTAQLEQHIDSIDKKLQPLHGFIIPGGGECSARYHLARTACRRSERTLVHVFSEPHYTIGTKTERAHIVQYINRLSDLFFTLARIHTQKEVSVV